MFTCVLLIIVAIATIREGRKAKRICVCGASVSSPTTAPVIEKSVVKIVEKLVVQKEVLLLYVPHHVEMRPSAWN
jgi:hypothetical protein